MPCSRRGRKKRRRNEKFKEARHHHPSVKHGRLRPQAGPVNRSRDDQLRQVRLEPAKRLKLFGKFAETRLDSIDQALNDPKQAQQRPAKIHDLLEDFSSIVDEMNDNLDMFQSDKILAEDEQKEYRKGLKELIAQDGKLRARLRTCNMISRMIQS